MEGDPCTSSSNCNAYLELTCSDFTHTCTKTNVAQAGQMCGVTTWGELVQCTSSHCNQTTKMCDAFAADGAACDAVHLCQPPATCTAGKCAVALPTCN